jgi:L-amino acid N-acyltransferase YncA
MRARAARADDAGEIREVGIHEKHGQLDGQWHDVVVVELLL